MQLCTFRFKNVSSGYVLPVGEALNLTLPILVYFYFDNDAFLCVNTPKCIKLMYFPLEVELND